MNFNIPSQCEVHIIYYKINVAAETPKNIEVSISLFKDSEVLISPYLWVSELLSEQPVFTSHKSID